MSSSSDISSILATEGFYLFSGLGCSMWPLIRASVDTVEVRPLQTAPKVGDVVLFSEGDHYVLHRVMKIDGGLCHTRGDNNINGETVPSDMIVAVMTGLWRGERKVRLDGVFCRFYVHLCIHCPALFTLLKKALSKANIHHA